MKQEAVRAIQGALRVFRVDPTTLSYFNLSFDGFVRSFFAMVLVYPLFLISAAANYGRMTGLDTTEIGDPIAAAEAPTLLTWLILKSVIFTLSWLAFTLVMVPISRLVQLDRFYVQYIIVWNWANVIATCIWFPALIVAASSDSVEQPAIVVLYAAQAIAFFYAFRVARVGLEAPATVAIGLVIFEFVLTLLIDNILQRIIF